ncbi:MAG: PorT family protein [Flavobacteriales bacterium]|nr:PorT family protein [Flavobacteriales bacterium]
MRTLLTVTILAVLTSTVQAQLEIRPYVGMNQQNLTAPPPLSSWKSATGYQFGADLVLGGRMFMSAGAQYMATSTVLNTTLTTQNTAEGTLNTGLLRIPLRLGLRLMDPSEQPLVNLRPFVGFAAGFPLSSSFDQDGVNNVELGTGQFHVTLGAGMDISIFFIDLGYDMGLNPVFDDNSFAVDSKSNILQVNAGLRLKFAR